MMGKLKFVAPLAAALLLAACGGGGSDDAPVAVDPLAGVPASASQSPQALVSYMDQLPPLNAEAREPMSLEAFMPPASEDSEPQEPSGG
jgi:ABC-type glycerol-3-phosphate transport system substrate-binding protein